MGEDRVVTTVTGCVSPVEQGAVLVLGRMQERVRPGDPTGSSGSQHLPYGNGNANGGVVTFVPFVSLGQQ